MVRTPIKQTTLIVDREQAKAQLQLLGYQPGDSVYMRFFVPNDDPRYGTAEAARKASKLNWAEVERYQNQGYGVYFVINGGGHTDEEVEVGRALFCEWDDRPIEEQVFAWQELNLLEPSMQIGTRKSVHNYWRANLTKEQWIELQQDLLVYTQSDQQLKNPSRVLRLAGAWHIKSGCEPIRCDIIHESNKVYTYEQLRAAIPRRQQAEQPTINYQPSISDDVPLYQFLTKDDRALIDQGATQGSRNSSGAKLARNLIGTATRLNHLGIRFSDDPRHLFHDYGYRCTPSLSTREVEAIWKSALKDNPTPSLTDDALENCAKAWLRNQEKSSGRSFGGGSGGGGNRRSNGGSGGSGGDGSDGDGGDRIVEGSKPSGDKSSSLSIREVVAKAEEILGTETDSLVQKIKLEELRQQAGINSYEWNVEYVNLIRNKLERQLAQDSRKENRRQALLAIACEKDPDEREDSIVALCRKSGWSRKYLESRIESLKAEEIKPKAKRMTFREFMEAENEPIKWIYSGLIPSLGVTLFCGDAGVGKSSAATDLAVSFVTGDEFLGEVSGLPGRVLYLMADEPSGYVQERLMHRLPLIECPQFETISNWDVSQMDLLVETIKDFKPNLVVVDGYNAIHATDPNYDENSSKAGKTIRTFDALSQTYGCGFVVIHHNGKGKDRQGVHKVRGSTDIPAAASTVLLFEKCPNGVYRRIKVEKTRSGTGNRSLMVGFDESTKRLVLVNSDEDKETKSLSQYIFDFLKGNQGTFFEQGEIQLQMQLNNSSSVYAALKRLANRSQIVRRPSKKINAGKRCLIYGIPATVTPPPNTKETHPPVCVKVSDLEAENYTQKGVDKSYVESYAESDINLTCELVADSQNSQNPCHVDNSLNLTYGATEGGVSPDLDMSDSTVTVANDEAIAPDPWEEEYTPINMDADGWGEIVRTAIENESEATEAVENEETRPFPGEAIGGGTKEIFGVDISTSVEPSTTVIACESLVRSVEVGDLIFVNCWPHTDKLGPYLVERIEGELAKVEMFARLVPITELRKV